LAKSPALADGMTKNSCPKKHHRIIISDERPLIAEKGGYTMSVKSYFRAKLIHALFLSIAFAILPKVALAATAKNVVLMISDGAGFNTFDCTSFYQHGKLGSQVYDSFPVHYGCTTYSADNQKGYDPEKFWSDFKYARKRPTDSAAAATAIYTGTKTENGRICTDENGKRLTTIAEIADSLGKSTGTISTVNFSHATPAAVWSHNDSRDHCEQIAREMICDSSLDVIMGCGHPRYDNNDRLLPMDDWEAELCGGENLFNELLTASTDEGWTFVESRHDFEAIASNTRPLFERVIGIARCRDTLQYERDGKGMGNLNKNVPTLATMTKAAINILAKNDNGFFLMIEGGAVDWASHANNLARMIEEQIDFNNAVEDVVKWVQTNSSWQQTLLIITADHETGQLWGPDAGPKSPTPFDLPDDNDADNLPAAKFYSEEHTNALVPLYAIGSGSELFDYYAKGLDSTAAIAWNFSGRYVDNTDVFTVMKAVITQPAEAMTK
jgi:alkaline phosphatase